MIPNQYYSSDQVETVRPEQVRLIHMGLPRSGTRYQFLILNELMPRGGLLSTHDPSAARWTDVPTLMSIRDPRDCVVSHWRFREQEADQEIMPTEAIERLGERYALAVFRFATFAAEANPIILRYELWRHDPAHLFAASERVLREEIDQATRTRLAAKYHIHAAKSMCDGEAHQGLAVPYEPRHVHEGQIGGWRRFCDAPGGNLMNRTLREALRQIGYETT